MPVRFKVPILWVAVVAASLVPQPGLAQSGPEIAPPVGGGPGSFLVYTPTAHALPAGRGYVQAAQILFPRFQVGITDRFSVGAGTFALYPKVAVLTPKLQVYRDARTSLATGLTHVVGPSKIRAGMAYVVSTTDVGDASVSGGVAVAYASYRDSGESRSANAVVGFIGAEFRHSARHSTLVDAHVFGGRGMAMIARRYARTHYSVDYGLLITVADGYLVKAPIVNLAWWF